MCPDSAEELAQMAANLRGTQPEPVERTDEQTQAEVERTQPGQETEEQSAGFVARLLGPKSGDEQLVQALHPDAEGDEEQ